MVATLSVCLIVRNEAELLAGCLASVKDVADQLVVVDTGSTDGTVGIAESFGAEVYDFEWVDDFAAARNVSLRQATSDWILWLDADERLLPESVEPLKRLLKKSKVPTAYRVRIKNLQRDRQSYTLSESHRLISNHPGVEFTGRIHEQVWPGIQALGGREKPSEVVLEHHGYALEVDAARLKAERNLALLETVAGETPASAYAQFTLGQNYALAGRYQDALKAYARALDLKAFTGTSQCPLLNALAEAHWGLRQLEEAKDCAQQSLAITARQTDANFMMYRIRNAQGDVPGQIDYLERVLAVTPRGQTVGLSALPQDAMIPRQHTLFSLGERYIAAGNLDKAYMVLRECRELAPGNREVLDRLIPVMADLGRWDEVWSQVASLPQPWSDDVREMGGVALIKLGRFEEAVDHYAAWLADQPSHEVVRRRLAGLYAKLGDREKAEEILMKGTAG